MLARARSPNPNATFTFVNSSVASFDWDTGRAWWVPVPAEPKDGGVAYPHSKATLCLSTTNCSDSVAEQVFECAKQEERFNTNVKTRRWRPGRIQSGIFATVQANDESAREAHESKGWINRTFAFVDDETPRACHNNGVNFTVNSWPKWRSCSKASTPPFASSKICHLPLTRVPLGKLLSRWSMLGWGQIQASRGTGIIQMKGRNVWNDFDHETQKAGHMWHRYLWRKSSGCFINVCSQCGAVGRSDCNHADARRQQRAFNYRPL